MFRTQKIVFFISCINIFCLVYIVIKKGEVFVRLSPSEVKNLLTKQRISTEVAGFKLERRDHTVNAGGLADLMRFHRPKEIASVELEKKKDKVPNVMVAGQDKTKFTRTGALLSSKKSILQSKFTKMYFGPVYILGAAMANSTETEIWDVVNVYAMIDMRKYADANVSCCLMYKTSEMKTDILKESPIIVHVFKIDSDIRGHQFACPNVKHGSGALPIGVGLTLHKINCSQDQAAFVQPYKPLREIHAKLAIGTKLAFGTISAEMIIEWMETYKYLGVDKVVTYYIDEGPHKINENALKVLRYYASTEILDLYHHVPAGLDIKKRIFHPPNRQKWNDNQMVVYDSFEKMSGYTYFGIIDHDEFLIPSRNRSLKQMLAELFSYNKKAAGFIFKTGYHYLTWNATGTETDMIIGTHIHTHGAPKLAFQKNIYRPKRIAFAGVNTHVMVTKEEFRMVTAPSSDGYLHHFRQCRVDKMTCLAEYNRTVDTFVADWSKRIYKSVQRVRRYIFGSEQPVL